MPVPPAEIARRAFTDHLASLPAAELLTRYATRADPEAFAGLVRQFGPAVLGVCRRVLGPSPDAEDAFQAVFLSLARQAGSFRDARALPAWLHRVTLRTARKALACRTATRTTAADAPEPADPADPLADVAAGREYAKLEASAMLSRSYWHDHALAFSPDGTTLAFLGFQQVGNRRVDAIQRWDVASKKYLTPLVGHYGIRSLAWSHDGKTLASAGEFEVMFWDVSRGK